MAFYARSEEARRSHSAHKLALVIFQTSIIREPFYSYPYAFSNPEKLQPSIVCLWLLQGALALEDALSKGLPIQTEIEALRNYLEGIDKDSILDVVLSSLPHETRNKGTYTLLQLNEKVS